MSVWGRAWWVVVFCAATSVIHYHFIAQKTKEIQHLSSRLGEIEKEKYLALQKREDYQLRITSQNDPAWIEMILMRDLGVVPEGFLKVHFKK